MTSSRVKCQAGKRTIGVGPSDCGFGSGRRHRQGREDDGRRHGNECPAAPPRVIERVHGRLLPLPGVVDSSPASRSEQAFSRDQARKMARPVDPGRKSSPNGSRCRARLCNRAILGRSSVAWDRATPQDIVPIQYHHATRAGWQARRPYSRSELPHLSFGPNLENRSLIQPRCTGQVPAGQSAWHRAHAP